MRSSQAKQNVYNAMLINNQQQHVYWIFTSLYREKNQQCYGIKIMLNKRLWSNLNAKKNRRTTAQSQPKIFRLLQHWRQKSISVPNQYVLNVWIVHIQFKHNVNKMQQHNHKCTIRATYLHNENQNIIH